MVLAKLIGFGSVMLLDAGIYGLATLMLATGLLAQRPRKVNRTGPAKYRSAMIITLVGQ